jgi:ABC-2 type transport system permease protein
MSTLTLKAGTHRRSAVIPSARRRRAFGRLVASEIKIAYRRPIGLVVAVGVPIVLLVIFGSIPATTKAQKSLGGISFFDFYVPTLMVFVLIVVALMGLPQQLTTYRQQGVLRRMSTTPVPPAWLLAAQVVVTVIFATIGIAILLGVGAFAFNLSLPSGAGQILLTFLALVLTAAALIGVGLCVGSVAGSPQAAHALTLVTFYPLAFFSGLYVPLTEIHSSLIHTIAKILPTGAGFNALHSTFTGHSASAQSLLVLVAWAIVTSVVAARSFRWE